MPVPRRSRLVLAATLLFPLLPLAGCTAAADPAPGGGDRQRSAAGAAPTPAGAAPASAGTAPAGTAPGTGGGDGRRSAAGAGQEGASVKAAPGPPAPATLPVIPGLGPATRARIPKDSRQAVVVRGDDRDASTSTATLYEHDPVTGWTAVSDPWPAHNAAKGWTDHHLQGDLRSPIGVYGLTDAGGLLDDPGAKLPYEQGEGFTVTGNGSLGEPLEGSFDYVVAINYNRRPGVTPLDWTRPWGDERGGGIWIHVDHDGPTQGCVSLERDRMRELLRWLDPEKKPVVVMGDVLSLGR
ncbi:L,D-transpeptidase family protein [Streptomyces sp. DH12]|uniref:L,D-transpeptidase family protein n=1 Tax=Streptomyces sp. DH12 TaxID=2857010 RepID=UPI001E3D0A38|nr:L,D-transpeptidase family protein [Streptomyces sp. DH12]